MTKKEADEYYSAWSAGYETGWNDGIEYMKAVIMRQNPPATGKLAKSRQSEPLATEAQKDEPETRDK